MFNIIIEGDKLKRIKIYLMNKSIGYKFIFYFFIVILGLIIIIIILGNLLYKEFINYF